MAEKVQSAVKAAVPAAERVAPVRAVERKAASVVAETREKPVAAKPATAKPVAKKAPAPRKPAAKKATPPSGE